MKNEIKLYTIPPYIFAGLQRWHRENFITRRTGFSSTEEQIIYIVAKEFSVSVNDLMSKSQTRLFTVPRQVAIYFCRKYTHSKLQKIAQLFDRDHSTIIYAISVINDLMLTDTSFQANIMLIDRLIMQSFEDN